MLIPIITAQGLGKLPQNHWETTEKAPESRKNKRRSGLEKRFLICGLLAATLGCNTIDGKKGKTDEPPGAYRIQQRRPAAGVDRITSHQRTPEARVEPARRFEGLPRTVVGGKPAHWARNEGDWEDTSSKGHCRSSYLIRFVPWKIGYQTQFPKRGPDFLHTVLNLCGISPWFDKL
jgi:hypothetical protein